MLYEKHGDGYKLIGVMYTAAKNATESELDERVPLSIAQWHAHVNLCLPPPDGARRFWALTPSSGSMARSLPGKLRSCRRQVRPQVFGWMVHVYPFEQKPEDIWSVGRQMHGHMD